MSERDYTLVLNMLDKVRKTLNNVCLTVTDIEYILQGLNNYYNGEENVSERRPTMDTSGDSIE